MRSRISLMKRENTFLGGKSTLKETECNDNTKSQTYFIKECRVSWMMKTIAQKYMKTMC